MANFEQLFKPITPEEIFDTYNVFSLAEKEFPVVTAGKSDHFNSMIWTLGGFGIHLSASGIKKHLRKPTAYGFFREDRYTLELIQREQTYTISFFPNEYKEQTFLVGKTSGRDSLKMQEVELTSVQTPSGNISFQEAKLILECKLTQLTTVKSEDYCAQEVQDSLNETYQEEKHYRKLVFGEITHVWVKK
jgi:flavin reductase (DIM6/NTAB) family NADH-FMN oxidoreductase RutF